jgi:hypothetical protein
LKMISMSIEKVSHPLNIVCWLHHGNDCGRVTMVEACKRYMPDRFWLEIDQILHPVQHLKKIEQKISSIWLPWELKRHLNNGFIWKNKSCWFLFW